MLFDKLFKRDEEEKPRRPARDPKARSKENQTKLTRIQHQKMDVKDLRVGMMVVELDIPWEESSFMFQGLELKSPADVLAIQEACSFVYVDYDEFSLQKDTPQGTGLPATPKTSTQLYKVNVEDEFDAAVEVHEFASRTVNTLFEDIRLGGEVDGAKVKQAVNGCVDSIVRNPDASIWLTRIQAKSETTAQHSMNVAALSIVIGKALNMSPQELEDLGCCAMLHDVGKTRVPEEIVMKPGPLTDEEMAEVRKHCQHGKEILMATKSVLSGAAEVAHAHHERVDGTGYPRGLEADKIPCMAKIVAIAEAYDCMTSRQVYREAISPSQALQELYAARGKQFDEDYVVKFIDSIGIFPPGSVIEMVNGEVAIVLANTTDKLRPRCILILDAIKEPALQRIVDLSQMEADDKGTVYQIKTTHKDGAFGIDIADFQRAGLRIG